MMALFNKGAVAVNIDASHKSLSFYESGVYFEPDCSEYRVPFICRTVHVQFMLEPEQSLR